MEKPLHIKYRPDNFDDVIGQDHVIDSIVRVLERKGSHAFLFSGPSGTGKTTLARIAAKELDCKDIIEIDAATYTGVDDMRQLKELVKYVPLGKGNRAIIVDECHMLSKSAWNSLLKVIEEPPDFSYWFFCTTEPSRVPPTIISRCSKYVLRAVEDDDLESLCIDVCKAEGFKLRDDIIRLIAVEAAGSPRQMLVNLELCRDAKDRRQAADLLQSARASEPVVELCRFITGKRGSWSRAMALVDKLEGESPESVRIVMCNYIAAALKSSTTDKAVCFHLEMLDNFSTPYNASEGLAPLLLSIGRTLYANG